MATNEIKVALLGNPNTGKTSVFNALTGLNQKVGNYPGITVEKKIGFCKLSNGVTAKILDLPGTYSLNTTSLDESIAVEILLNKKGEYFPDVAIVVAEVENLKRNLLLFSQIKDLGIPTVLVINMADRMQKNGISLDVESLSKELGTKVILSSVRNNSGISEIKQSIEDIDAISTDSFLDITEVSPEYFERLKKLFPQEDPYKLWLVTTQDVNFTEIDKNQQAQVNDITTTVDLRRYQHKETVLRYKKINASLKKAYLKDPTKATSLKAKIDSVLTHKVWGYLIFFAILFLIFQVIYDWSNYPMDLIDGFFASASNWVSKTLPSGMFTNLIAEGILAGIGGIVIFIPQIAFLFLFISILEESGYMSRVVFLMDKLMRPFGLSGKSVVPLMSGTACAIPAIMASRTIENWKERLITILVIPFTTCSARLPVYLIIISIVIPEGNFMFISYQAFTLMALYILGFGVSILSAWILHKILKIKTKSFFVMEMPGYKMPQAKNVGITVLEKTKSFVFGAGKIILAISVILWFLGSYGLSEDFKNAEKNVDEKIASNGFSDFNKTFISSNIQNYELSLRDSVRTKVYHINNQDIQDSLAIKRNDLIAVAKEDELAGYKLEHSFMGQMGKAFEPLVKPLGYDWKIGIAVLASFAAREVFVGTLATIYSVGSGGEEEETIKERLAAEVHPSTQKPVFNFASGISILLFYAFAMQCMSTLAIVKRETNTWKWPMLQLGIMTGFAYLVALIAYQFLK